MERPLPTAVVRLARRPIAVLAIVLVSAIAASASQIGSSAAARITTELNAHWRGAYDILVRPAEARLGLEKTSGFVEPNFVALGGRGGITRAQVAEIRAIQGVEFAAPIAWVGLLSTRTSAPSIELNKFPAKPTLYSVTLRVTTRDGVRSHSVFEGTMKVFVAPPKGVAGKPVVISGAGGALLGQLPDGSWSAEISAGHALPQIQSPLIAVEPEAERALLGDRGTFLDPLIALPDREALQVGTTDPRIVLPGYDQGSEIAVMQQNGGAVLNRPVFPVLVSAKTYAPVELSIEVSQIGHPIDAAPDRSNGDSAALDAAAQAAGPGLTAIGSNAIDWADSMRAFRMNAIGVAWPGSQLGAGGLPAFFRGISYRAMLAERPSYSVLPGPTAGSGTPAFRITPLGAVPPGGPAADDWTDPQAAFEPGSLRVGAEQSYRALQEVTEPIALGFTSKAANDAPYVLAPVGEYDLGALQLPRDPLDYVPYGAYDAPDTRLISDASGRPLTPIAMTPTLNPTGLLSVPPMGIVDIHAAELLRGPAPIDAVRVRVRGITGYGPEAVAKVERVAGAIADLGFDVDIVAASSPQTVDVYVPEYNLDTTPAGDLGWVEQHWTTLGATPRVEHGLNDTNAALLLLALVGLVVVVGSSELITASVRVRDAGILSAIGWRRRQIVAWQATESAMAGLTAVVLGVVAWLLVGQRDPLGLAVVVSAGILFVSFGLLGAISAQRAGRSVSTSSARSSVGPSVAGLRSYAWRTVAARPWRSVMVIVGVALSAAVIAPAGALISALGARVGPTALATALSDRLQPYQLALLGVIAASALTCAFLALRVDLESRRREFVVLEAAGWTSRRITQMLAWSRFCLAIPAALVAGMLAGLLADPIAGANVPLPAIVGLGAVIAFATMFAFGRLARPSAPSR
jgi:hypothetical protein